MKILHWDEMFHPDFGYQINLLAKFQSQQGHEIVIMTSEEINQHPTFKEFANQSDINLADKRYESENNVKIIRLPIHRVISGRVIYKRGFIKEINKQHADIIMCHTNDTLSAIIIAVFHHRITAPLIFDNHMLEMASHNKLSALFHLFYRVFITPIYKKNKWIVFRTQDDPYVNTKLGIPNEQTPFMSFGSDIKLFHPDEMVRKKFREEYSIPQDAFIVIYAGKLTQAKGGPFLAEALKKKIEADKKLVFIIVGNSSFESQHNIEDVFKTSENTIIRMPTQNYINLAFVYQAADLAVFPKQVSLSFFDVQASGLPVICASNNINEDRLSHENGFVYKLNDLKDFRRKITKCVCMDSVQYNKMRINSRRFVEENYSYIKIAEQCTETMLKELKRQKKSNLVNSQEVF